jgi:hypothetical protein
MTRIELPRERKVGHLTLIREARSITPKEFNALRAEERLEMIRHAQGRQKYNLMLEAGDFGELIWRLPAQDIYLLIKELGFEAVAELLPHLSVPQFTACLDLDGWQGDVLDAVAVFPWLASLLERSEEEIVRLLEDLDFPLLVLVFRTFVTVTAGPDDIEDEEVRIEATQHDGGYVLDFRDSEQAKVVGALLGLVFRQDREFFTFLMEAMRHESQAILEEDVYQQRRGRLEDLGFPDPFSALAVYSWLDPDTFTPAVVRKLAPEPAEEEVIPPGFLLAAGRSRDLFAEVLGEGLAPAELWELTFLINKVLIADRVDVGDAEVVQQSAEEVYHTLSLALEFLAGDDVTRAREVFGSCYVEHLFQVGYSLLLRLQRRATAVAGSVVAPYLDGPFRALVEALRRSKPRFFRGIERVDQGGERSFATLREVRLAEEWLERLEVQQRLFTDALPFRLPTPEAFDLVGCIPESGDDMALSDFFLTALANRLLGRSFAPTPIHSTELPALHGRICAAGRLVSGLREETAAWLESLLPGAGAFGDYCLDLWEEEFCPTRPEDLDPRYLGGLIVRLV